MTTAAILAPESATELPPEPYPGLRPFEPTEWAIFFGREPMTDEVITRLAAQHLVVVHGASGCGKSSLVRAGVLPWLGLDHARSSKPWKTAVARPGGGPLRNIACALAQELGPPPGPSFSADAATAWHDRLAVGRAVLDDISEALQAQDSASLCILIDQFEELFRYAREQSREETQLLMEILEGVADPEVVPRGLFLILTMRSDYLGDCARFAGFAEIVNRCQYLLPRMDEFALLRAVHEPARLFGGQIESAVGDRLLFAAQQEEDALPVLQHALMRACAHAREHCGNAQRWTVTLTDLQTVEGEHGALSEHAEEVLDEAAAGDPVHLKAAEWLFRSLTDLDAEGRVIRHPCRLADLIAISGSDRATMTAVIEAFRASGRSFLTPYLPNPLGDDTEIDVSHEALIRRWRRLSDPARDPETKEPVGWLWREFEDGQRWRALAVQARTFCDDPSATLSPATTEAYERWWPEHTPAWAARYARAKDQAFEEYREVEELWRASKQALKQERTRLEHERRLRRQAQVSAAIAIALLMLVTIALAGLGWFYSAAKVAEDQAKQQTRLVEQQLAQIATAAIDRNGEGPVTAALTALRGLPARFDPPDRPFISDTAVALGQALAAQHEHLCLHGHEGALISAAFSPDGARIATTSLDKTARVWDAATGRELFTLRGHEGALISAAFSPDGARIATTSLDKTARVWDAATGRELLTLRGHEDRLTWAAFSPDGARIATTSLDGTARVWAAATGRELLTLRGHGDGLTWAAFSPDGARIVTASWDKTARVWSTASRSELLTLRGHGDGLTWAAFSPDGARIATTSLDGTARVWAAATGRELFTLRGHEDRLTWAAFSPDGARIVTASWDKTARVWDAATGRELLTLRGHEHGLTWAAFSPDGARIVTASWDKTARVWDAATGRELLTLRGHGDGLTWAAFSPDGARIATTSLDKTARVWSTVSRSELLQLRLHENRIMWTAFFSPDGARIVTASHDETARVWDAATGRELLTLRGHEHELFSAAFSPDGARIVTASWDKTARVWDAATGRELLTLRGHEDGLFSAAFSPDGARVVTASWDKTARVWDAATGRELLTLRGHKHGLTWAAFSPDGARIVTVSQNETVRVWDAATGRELLTLRGHEDGLISAAFSPDGARIATTSLDGTARVWDAATGRELLTLRGHEDGLTWAAFSPDGARIATASLDKTARVWDAATGRELLTLRGHGDGLTWAAFSPDGARIITASWDKTARVWQNWRSLEELVQQAHSQLRGLTSEEGCR